MVVVVCGSTYIYIYIYIYIYGGSGGGGGGYSSMHSFMSFLHYLHVLHVLYLPSLTSLPSYRHHQYVAREKNEGRLSGKGRITPLTLGKLITSNGKLRRSGFSLFIPPPSPPPSRFLC
jgi:hypothetical protein